MFLLLFLFSYSKVAQVVILMFQSLCNTNVRNVVIVGDFPVHEK